MNVSSKRLQCKYVQSSMLMLAPPTSLTRARPNEREREKKDCPSKITKIGEREKEEEEKKRTMQNVYM